MMQSEPTKHLIEFPKEGCVYASPDQFILAFDKLFPRYQKEKQEIIDQLQNSGQIKLCTVHSK